MAFKSNGSSKGVHMFPRMSAAIRRLPWWGQALSWPFYGALVLFTTLTTGAVQSFFGSVVKGSVMGALIKITAAIILVAVVVSALGAKEWGGAIFTLAAIPIVLIGFVFTAKGVFAPQKKKKKKK